MVKLTGTILPGRPRMNFKEMGVSTRNWVDSAHVSDYWRVLVNETLNLRVP